MTFALYEESDGSPLELYIFTYDTSTYRYTSGEADYVDTSVSPQVTYTAAPIDRTEIASTYEDARNSLTITLPRTNTIAELFRVSPPTSEVSITVKRVHRDYAAEVTTAWMGRVLNCSFEAQSAVLTCEPILIAMDRTGLRRMYSKVCSHVLYGASCGVTLASVAQSVTVSAVSGLTLTVGAMSATYNYAGGFVAWVDANGNTQRRFVESYTNAATSPDTNTLTLTLAFQGIAPSDSVTVYPGCDHTLTTCDAVFGNSLRYGGFPYIPQKNPYDGTPTF